MSSSAGPVMADIVIPSHSPAKTSIPFPGNDGELVTIRSGGSDVTCLPRPGQNRHHDLCLVCRTVPGTLLFSFNFWGQY